jgi:hypothetical protein
MADFMATCASNDPKLKDHEAVEQIISRFYFDPNFNVGLNFDDKTGEPYLFIYGYRWPEAWKVPAGIAPDDFDPYTEDVYEEGNDGFIAFLRVIAPHLAEPLTVQAVGNIRCQFPLSACEWHVQPNATNVQVNEFRHGSEPIALANPLSEAS